MGAMGVGDSGPQEPHHRIWLGSYSSPEKVARTYDAAVYCLRGDRALAAHEVKAIAMRHAFSVVQSLKESSSSPSASTGARSSGRTCMQRQRACSDGRGFLVGFPGP
ncbi:hypothetical protein COCNU_02G019950 [Cocos nucifera]|uniref:AP2/ERF domain-containing protein n=1 Tax=Cocos nucifera TaxID=13894 RepID=A0A8K0I1S7_COCNU|nr:hypothetical protein COCNU_02G019950 [Cocos nucifera]